MIQKDYNHWNKIPQEQYTPNHQERQEQTVIIRRRIGSTTYRMNVHFNHTSRETMQDKILRLAKSEVMEE